MNKEVVLFVKVITLGLSALLNAFTVDRPDTPRRIAGNYQRMPTKEETIINLQLLLPQKLLLQASLDLPSLQALVQNPNQLAPKRTNL